MYFYKLKSHQDSLLVDHLKFVGDRGAILIENKSINFKYSKGQLQHTAKVIGYCHDLGKGTKYFQDYLLGKNSVKDKLKAHAFLSSLICFYNVKEKKPQTSKKCQNRYIIQRSFRSGNNTKRKQRTACKSSGSSIYTKNKLL